MYFCIQSRQKFLESVVQQKKLKGWNFSGNTISISRYQDLKFMNLKYPELPFNALKREISPHEKCYHLRYVSSLNLRYIHVFQIQKIYLVIWHFLQVCGNTKVEYLFNLKFLCKIVLANVDQRVKVYLKHYR